MVLALGLGLALALGLVLALVLVLVLVRVLVLVLVLVLVQAQVQEVLPPTWMMTWGRQLPMMMTTMASAAPVATTMRTTSAQRTPASRPRCGEALHARCVPLPRG